MRYALVVVAIGLSGCTSSEALNEAVDALVAKRLYCTQAPEIDFTYTKGRPEISDTLPTIEQIREGNAARDTICGVQPTSEQPSSEASRRSPPAG